MARQDQNHLSHGPQAVKPELSSQSLRGAWRATVEFNADPQQLGRVKVRLWTLHGPQGTEEKTQVHTQDLPWALPAFALAGGQDFGSFMVPPVGSTVWIMTIGGDPDQFVYFGGYYTINKEGEKYLRAMEKPEHEVSMAGTKDQWTGTLGPETPLDALEMLHATPEVYVPAKSVKGASLVMDDKDERESMRLIDRAGQGLFFEAEAQKTPNRNNAAQRQARNLARGKSPLKIGGDTVAGETRVFLIDAAGQAVVLSAHTGSERLRLLSRPVDDDSASSGSHKAGMSIDIDSGNRRIVLASSSSGDSGTRIVLDAEAKYVEISGDVTVRIVASSVEISGRVAIRGDCLIEGDAVVSGDLVVAGKITGGE